MFVVCPQCYYYIYIYFLPLWQSHASGVCYELDEVATKYKGLGTKGVFCAVIMFPPCCLYSLSLFLQRL